MEKSTSTNKPSAVRDKIIEVLKEKKEALSHRDFQDLFQGKWDRVTIYRALDKLVEIDKIHKVTGIEGTVQYALCSGCESHTHNHNHVHFNCSNCHKVVCIENVIPTIKLPEGFLAHDVQCMVTGICSSCS